MSNGVLVNPQLVINGETVSIVPNSLTLIVGRGTKEVNVEAAGTVLNTVVSDNLEDAVAVVKFSMYFDVANFNIIEGFRSQEGTLTVEMITPASDNQDSLTQTVTNGTVTTDIEYAFKSQGTFEVEIKGAQAA